MPDWSGSENRTRQMHLMAVQSAYSIPGVRTVVYVADLNTLGLMDMADVAAIHYLRKGFSDHVEVVCRIKGISLIRVDKLNFIQDAYIQWPRSLPSTTPDAEDLLSFGGNFQASIFDQADLGGLNFSRIDTVFVRFEHLLYGAIAKAGEYPDSLDAFQLSVREELVAIASGLPSDTTLLVRGLDVRSNDRLLSRYFFDEPEPETNPELGQHGTRYLLNRPWVVEFMANLLDGLPGQVRFACPFVSTYREYMAFVERYSFLFGNQLLIPFAESPAILEEIGLYKVDKLCIGLKDLTQFYFAADRGNSHIVESSSYLDPYLISTLARTVRVADQIGIEVHLYQQSDTLRAYTNALTGIRWVPSLAAFDLRCL